MGWAGAQGLLFPPESPDPALGPTKPLFNVCGAHMKSWKLRICILPFTYLGMKALVLCSCSFTLHATDYLKPVILVCVPLSLLEIHSHWISRFLNKC